MGGRKFGWFAEAGSGSESSFPVVPCWKNAGPVGPFSTRSILIAADDLFAKIYFNFGRFYQMESGRSKFYFAVSRLNLF